MYRNRIRENYERLSKSQKRIADFLMTSHREAAFMTASQLADILTVDVATITRFAQRLGYPGYPEMLDEVQAVVRAEMSAGYRPVEATSEAGRLFIRTLMVERENLEHTMTNISVEAAEQAIAILANARAIYVAGQHTAALLAVSLVIRLQMVGLTALPVIGDPVRVAIAARHLGAEDAVIGFGFSGYAAHVAALMHVARDRGAKTIAVTGSDVSPISRMADVVLICAATSPIHIPSEVSLNAVVEGIFQTLATQRKNPFNENMQAFGALHQSFNHYLTNPLGSVEESIMKLY